MIPTLSLQILCAAIVEWMEWNASKSGASSSSSPTISGDGLKMGENQTLSEPIKNHQELDDCVKLSHFTPGCCGTLLAQCGSWSFQHLLLFSNHGYHDSAHAAGEGQAGLVSKTHTVTPSTIGETRHPLMSTSCDVDLDRCLC